MPMTYFNHGDPGTPATFEGVLGSFHGGLVDGLFPRPEQKVWVAVNETYTVTGTTVPQIIRVMEPGTVVFTGSRPADTQVAFMVYGYGDFSIQASGVTNNYKENAVLVLGTELGYRCVSAGSDSLTMDEADLLLTAQRPTSAVSLYNSARTWLDEELSRIQRITGSGIRSAYLKYLDYNSNTLAESKSFLSTPANNVHLNLVSSARGVHRIHIGPGPNTPYLIFNCMQLSLPSTHVDTSSVYVSVSTLAVGRPLLYSFTQNPVPWASGASPGEVMNSTSTTNNANSYNVPNFSIHRVDNELFFVPQILSPN